MNKKLLILPLFALLVGCSNKVEHYVDGYFYKDEFVFPFNTIAKLTMYNENKLNNVVDEFDNIVTNTSKSLDRYHSYDNYNNLYLLNKNGFIENCDQVLYDTIKLSYELTLLTDQKYNMFISDLSDLYADSIENSDYSKMPSENDINDVVNNLNNIDYNNILLFNDSSRSITINTSNSYRPSISVGGIGKGICLDKTFDYINNLNYSSIINLGNSSIGLTNKNPTSKNKKFTMGVIMPYLNNQNESSYIIELDGGYKISTSGDYENCYLYQSNTKLMHHIINSKTGYSNNTYRLVTLISKDCNGSILDALSTAIFNSNDDNDAISTISLIETAYNCHIDYCMLKPYKDENNNIDWNKFIPTYSSGFKSLMISDFNKNIIN